MSLSISAHCCEHSIGVQAVDHGHPFGMVGDGDVFHSALFRGLGHFLDRGQAVGPGAMRMQIAADVAEFDEFGEFSGIGPFEFAARLAQFRGNAGQAQGGVNVFFAAPGDHPFAAKNAVFVDFKPLVFCPAAEHDVVLLSTR